MADIVVHNIIDRTQFAFNEVGNEVAAILVAAGIATYTAKKAAPKPPAEWRVGFNKVAERYFIRHIVGATTTVYDGPAAGAKRAFPDCPQAIIDELAASQKQEEAQENNRLWQATKMKTSYK